MRAWRILDSCIILLLLMWSAGIAEDVPRFPLDENAGAWYALTYNGHNSFYDEQGGEFQQVHQYSAIDLNIDGDADNGLPVYAIQSGQIWDLNTKGGGVTIKHDKELKLRNGYVYDTGWISGYGHMKDIQVEQGQYVNKGDKLGYISNVGTEANHLHFSMGVYDSKDISPYWLPGYYTELDYRETDGTMNKSVFRPMPGDETLWYNISVNKPNAKYNDVTDTDRNAYFEGYIKYPLNSTLNSVGCFLSANKADIEAATPDDPGAAYHVSDPSGMLYEELSDGRSTHVFYKAQNAPSDGFGVALNPGTEYFYRFYATRIVNGEVKFDSSDIMSFKTTGESISTVSSIEFTPLSLDFGTIYAGYESTVDRVLTIKNTGSAAVTLSTAACPSNFKVKSVGKTSLAAGESTTMVITPKTGLAAGNHDADFYVTSDKSVASPVKLEFSVQQMEHSIGDKYYGGCPECESENMEVVGYKTVGMSNYADNDDGTHGLEAEWATVAYCYSCGATYSFVVGNNVVTVVEEHSRWSGKCWACGNVDLPCEHSSADYQWIEDIGKPEYINEKCHWVSSKMQLKFQCGICGETHVEPYSEFYSSHYPLAAEKCEECGSTDVSICCSSIEEEWKSYLEILVRYVDIKTDTHTSVYVAGDGFVCAEHGEIRTLYRKYRNRECTVPHTYVKGVCECGKSLFDPSKSLTLPSALSFIESEAFYGNPVHAVFIPDTCESIGSLAFAYCTQLEYIEIPASVTQIAGDAFEGCSGLTICSPAGSYAQTYAQENSIAWMEL